MLTEECGLNPYLEARGIEVVDTDLGERIVQLRQEGPSRIVMPAIHLWKEEVGEAFNADLGMSRAPAHIASVGSEKVIPRLEDLAVFLRLLARSATGQAVTAYTSH